MQPCCPHCPTIFETWHDAKRHVKHCKSGKPRPTLAERLNMTHYGGNTSEANAPILSARFWKKGTQVIGRVTRLFETDNGICYTIVLNKPMSIDRTATYPSGTGKESMERVSVGALKGFEMALQSSGIPGGKLMPGDKIQITCTGTTPTGKGNDQVDFDVQIDRQEENIPF